jgi:hypothetical protein
VHAPEQRPGDERRGQRPAPVAKRREDVAAKQELLADRRDHTRQRGAQDQQHRPFVGAERFDQLRLFFGMHERRPHGAEHDERDQQREHQPAGHTPAGAGTAQAELPGAHGTPAELREEHRHRDETDVLDDRVRDRHPGGGVRGGDVRTERQRRDLHQHAAEQRHGDSRDERRGRAPGRPAGGRGARALACRLLVHEVRPPSARWRTERRKRPSPAPRTRAPGAAAAGARPATRPARCRAGTAPPGSAAATSAART